MVFEGDVFVETLLVLTAALAMLVVPTLLAPADGDPDIGEEDAPEPSARD